MLYHSVAAGELIILTTSDSLSAFSHPACEALATFIPCFPTVLSLSPFTSSKTIAFRPLVGLASIAFYFGLYFWVCLGGLQLSRASGMEEKGVSQWAEGQYDVLGPCREVREQLWEAAAQLGWQQGPG